VYLSLSLEEEIRNQFGDNLLFVGKQHPARGLLESLYEQQEAETIDLDPDLTKGMSGTLMTDQQRRCIPGKPVQSPLLLLPDLTYNGAV
jgi:5'-3' exonuclease